MGINGQKAYEVTIDEVNFPLTVYSSNKKFNLKIGDMIIFKQDGLF